MPYVSPVDALNPRALDLDELSREQGLPPWRVPLVGSDATRWVLLCWPPGQVSVPHFHPRAEETFYVLRGRALFRFGGEDADRDAGPGTVLLAPRGVMHTIGVPGSEPLLMLASVSPNEDAADETVEDPAAPTVTL
jgi:quercetin dioxygenase-like cupin family protein